MLAGFWTGHIWSVRENKVLRRMLQAIQLEPMMLCHHRRHQRIPSSYDRFLRPRFCVARRSCRLAGDLNPMFNVLG